MALAIGAGGMVEAELALCMAQAAVWAARGASNHYDFV